MRQFRLTALTRLTGPELERKMRFQSYRGLQWNRVSYVKNLVLRLLPSWAGTFAVPRVPAMEGPLNTRIETTRVHHLETKTVLPAVRARHPARTCSNSSGDDAALSRRS